MILLIPSLISSVVRAYEKRIVFLPLLLSKSNPGVTATPAYSSIVLQKERLSLENWLISA